MDDGQHAGSQASWPSDDHCVSEEDEALGRSAEKYVRRQDGRGRLNR